MVFGIFLVSMAVVPLVVERRERRAWKELQQRLDGIHQEWEERRAVLDRQEMERKWGVNFDFDTESNRERR